MSDSKNGDGMGNIHDGKGPSPLISRSLILQAYSPLVSVISSQESELLVQRMGIDSFLQLIKPFGINLKGTFRVKNHQLISRTFNEFNIKFTPSLIETLSLQVADNELNISTTGNQKLLYPQLFNSNSLELLMDEYIKQVGSSINKDELNSARVIDLKNSIYLKFFSKIISCPTVVPFETFNHPIAQIFTVNSNDSLESVKKLIANFRNSIFPKYFNIDDLLMFIVIVHDNDEDIHNATVLSDSIRSGLGFGSVILRLDTTADDKIPLAHSIISSIDEDLQNIQLPSKINTKMISKQNVTAIQTMLIDFINKHLFPFMERKLMYWDDQVVAPKKSITGKFFAASKKFFNNSNSSLAVNNPQANSNYNSLEGYYNKNSPEQIIRKLADWSFMLKDFKYSYQNYELLKKDFLNDKAWAYVASGQEMSIISLLLGSSFNSNNIAQTNTLLKIKQDIIEPYLDSLNYSYLARTNLKSYSVKAIITIIELLINNNLWIIEDVIVKWLIKLNDLDAIRHNGRCLVLERIGYVYWNTVHPAASSSMTKKMRELKIDNKPLEDGAEKEEKTEERDDEEEDYINPLKLHRPDNAITGLTRNRKSAFWYLIAAREWDPISRPIQVQLCLESLKEVYNDDLSWIGRSDELFGRIKQKLEI